MADSSFDIVSKVDRQEADNALNQTAKELAQRFDFKNTDTTIEWKGELGIEIASGTEERAKAALDVFKEKIIKRGMSLKCFEADEPRSSGKGYKISGTFKAGINQEQAKKIGKLIRDEGPKSVKAQVMGEELRVTSKSRDDLQAVFGRRASGSLTCSVWLSSSMHQVGHSRTQIMHEVHADGCRAIVPCASVGIMWFPRSDRGWTGLA